MTEYEEWRPVVGYEGWYEVSNHGRVRSLDRQVEARNRFGSFNALRQGGLMTCYVDTKGSGYVCVGLSKDGWADKLLVHILVLTAFKGPRPTPRHQCLHDDGDRTNPRLNNLKWGTPSENMQDKVRHGTHARGERNKNSKLSAELVGWIKESPQSSLALAPILQVSGSTIRAVRIGQNWSHGK